MVTSEVHEYRDAGLSGEPPRQPPSFHGWKASQGPMSQSAPCRLLLTILGRQSAAVNFACPDALCHVRFKNGSFPNLSCFFVVATDLGTPLNIPLTKLGRPLLSVPHGCAMGNYFSRSTW